jgi:hypothetical protein
VRICRERSGCGHGFYGDGEAGGAIQACGGGGGRVDGGRAGRNAVLGGRLSGHFRGVVRTVII